MKIINICKITGLAALTALFLPSCDTSDGTKGALIGGGAGAGLGAIIGKQSGHTKEGALIGAGAGALTGKLIGDESDKRKQDARIRELERREYERSRGYNSGYNY